jgi:hypothetical protein
VQKDTRFQTAVFPYPAPLLTAQCCVMSLPSFV